MIADKIVIPKELLPNIKLEKLIELEKRNTDKLNLSGKRVNITNKLVRILTFLVFMKQKKNNLSSF